MNVYDTANKLATEIKASEEYVNYKMAKEALNLNAEVNEKMKNFEKLRYEFQMQLMQTGKRDEEKFEKMQTVYAEIVENPEGKKYIETETAFNILVADVNKIIGEAIQDVMN
jgi:cell fate (sporulation/competence/biofilm development) regulator YlbF (YheA/YmcA/DUF963 family)